MVAEHEISTLEFSGTKKIKDIATRAFEAMRSQGMFMSANAPIIVPLDSLTAFLVEKADANPADVAAALSENSAVFAVESREGIEVVITTRDGRPPVQSQRGVSHSFDERFLKPQPKPERPPKPLRERVKVDPNWATLSVPDYVDEDEEADLDAVAASEAAEVARAAEAAQVIAAQAARDIEEAAEVRAAEAAKAARAAEIADPDVQVIIEPVGAPVGEEATTTFDEPVLTEAEAETVVETPLQDVTEARDVEPIQLPVEQPVSAAEETAPEEVPVPSAPPVDLSGVDDASIAAAIEAQLGSDPRSAYFAGQWMVEERVPRLSRGDLRRAKEYIQEQEQPLTDAVLAQDILNVRPNSVEFDLMQFAVNFRLSREHRDFDFVGTSDQRFWSTSSLPQIGTTRRKPNEIGTDYRFLTEETGEVEYRSVASVDHILTFYEFSLGLLPYTDDLKRLLPKPVTEEQRSAVLTFEIPQSYTTYLVELRYPTPNRGGFLLGLDDFYAENLVPGAILSLTATENDGHYKVEYLPAQDQNARLLELDDRRSPRYHFRPTTFHCEVSPEWLISEDRFPRLGAEKPLDDRIRRRPEAVVDATFERIGIEDGGAHIASFEDLLAAVNIERPFSEALLRSALEQDSKVSGDGSDTYTYVPSS